MDYKIIATPIVGAIIGYSTNWIAIKMLFRPYEEKRIFGLKVPFTPGLIPKERSRIALAMGNVVEQYLLTHEVIMQELTSDKIKESISSIIDDELKSKDHTIYLSMFVPNSEDLEKITQATTELCYSKLCEFINNDDFKIQIKTIISKEIINALKTKSVQDIIENNKDVLSTYVQKIVYSDQLKNQISKKIYENLDPCSTIEGLLGDELLEQIKSIISYNELNIKAAIDALLSKEEIAESIKSIISEMVSKKFGVLGAMLANADSIYESIITTIREKIAITSIADPINSYVTEIFKKQINEMMSEDSRKAIIDTLLEQLLKPTHSEYILELISNQDSAYNYLNNMMDGTFDEKINIGLNTLLEQSKHVLIQEEQLVKVKLSQFISSTFNRPIYITEKVKNTVISHLLKGYSFVVNKYLLHVIKNASISSIVAEQINTFGVHIVEEMILAITKKELNTITWLGALLGFIMSIVLLFIQ